MIQDADALLQLCRTTMKEDPDHPDLQELEEKFYEMERAESRVRLAQFDSEPFLIIVSGGWWVVSSENRKPRCLKYLMYQAFLTLI